MTYYNTTGEAGAVLGASQRQAESQEEKILCFFKKYPDKAFTPYAVQRYLRAKWPITSIRRAMTNLTNEGKLEKLKVLRQEKYGKSNHIWTLADKDQMALL